MRHFALGRKDGGVTILTIIKDDATPEGELAKWSDVQREAVVEIVEIQVADIPTDRSNRDNWRLESGRIVTQ